MKAMIVKELKLIGKDKRSFFFLLLMPALFIVMFHSVFGSAGVSGLSIHAIDQDGSEASRALLSQLGTMVEVELDDPSSLDEQIGKIKQGQFAAVLVIPSGFASELQNGQNASLKLYEDPASQTALAPIHAVLGNLSDRYRELKISRALQAHGENEAQVGKTMASPIRIESVPTASDQIRYVDQVVPGMTVMFVFFIMITMTRRFFEEKKTGLLARIRSTRIRPIEYLIGMWVPFVLTVIAQCAILFAFGHFVYGLHVGDLSALALVVLGLSIAGTGIGLGMSLIVPGESAAMVITQLISMGGAMVGGLWFPTYMMPQLIQTIGHFTPQYWAQHSLLDIVAHGAHVSDVLGGVLVLLVFGLAGLAVAFFRLPGFLRSAVS
jgi:ABC-2 type transport system permease protein